MLSTENQTMTELNMHKKWMMFRNKELTQKKEVQEMV